MRLRNTPRTAPICRPDAAQAELYHSHDGRSLRLRRRVGEIMREILVNSEGANFEKS